MVTVMGVEGVVGSGVWQMSACSTCKRQVEGTVCDTHPNSVVELRYILQLEVADDYASGSVTLYHDTAMKIPALARHQADLNAQAKKELINFLQAQIWSLRVVYKTNDYKQTNYLEIKSMQQTITPEGVPRSWPQGPLNHVPSGGGCPVTRSADVEYDPCLGFVLDKGRQVSAVRLLVTMLPVAEDVDIAIPPDVNNQGLRVTRMVTCALAPEPENGDERKKFAVTCAGPSRAVNWLIGAAPDSVFFMRVSVRPEQKHFQILTRLAIEADKVAVVKTVLLRHMDRPLGSAVPFDITETPLKRKKTMLDENMQETPGVDWSENRVHLDVMPRTP
jgi:hypothetical protein